MNKERLRKLADRLDRTAPERFDMGKYCGTACCIGGHARLMARKSREQWPIIFCGARDYLELNEDTARALMEPGLDHVSITATPKQAAKVVRHLAKTGKVEWEKFL